MRFPAAGLSAVLLTALVFLARPWMLEDLDNRAFDLFARWTGGPAEPSSVVIVEIDEESVSRSGRWPWSRETMAALIRRILDSGAAVVALDLVFPGPKAEAGPGESGTGSLTLARALSGQPVVVGYSFLFEDSPAGDTTCEVPPLPLVVSAPDRRRDQTLFRARSLLCSDPEIAKAAGHAGFLNAAPDRDGRYRRLPLLIERQGATYPSLALSAYLRLKQAPSLRLSAGAIAGARLQLGPVHVPLEDPGCLRLRFRGPGRSFPYVSAARLLSSSLPESALRGKVVVLGVTATGLQDTISTPFDTVFPGVELHATAIDNLLTGRVHHRPGEAGLWELALSLAAAFATTLALRRLAWPSSALVAAAIAAACWLVCLLLLSTAGVLLSPLPATAAAVAQYSTISFAQRRGERRASRETESRLSLEKQRAQQALELSERRYRQLVENVNDAITVSDLEGRLVFANQRFREWFGLAAGSIHSVRLDDCVTPESRGTLRSLLARIAAGEPAPAQCEFEALRADGSRMWLEARFSVAEENGRAAGIQSALRDITERKQIEAQYLQAQKMESVGRLAGGVAHDFNNLLTIINGFADLLLESEPGNPDLRHGLMEIRRAGLRAAELTANLLAFSRGQRAKPRPLDVNQTVDEALGLCRRLLGEDIEIVTRLDSGSPYVTADPGQLHQVLMNLAVNARDSMPHGGTFTVSTSVVAEGQNLPGRPADAPPGPWVRLEVSDTGTGMTEEVKLRLFEPFFTTKEQGKGTGLGLSTVYGIVRQSGGWIAVESELGRGSRFLIYLPLARPAGSAGSAPDRFEPPGRGSETILLVEDQEAVLKLFTQVLEANGYRVLSARTGPEAIRISEEFSGPVHLLLTDVVLPQMSGREVAAQLQRARPGIKVLFTSGRALEEAHLPKPCSPAGLTAKVREVLAAPPPA